MKAKRTGLYSVVAVAGALSVGTAPAWTQQSGQKSPQDRASQSRQQAEMSRNLVSVEHLKDQEVLDTNNREVGNISGVYINPQSGRVERVGIEFSDSMFGRDHKYSVGWDKLKVRKQGDETLVTLDQSVIQRVQQAGKSGRVQEGDLQTWVQNVRRAAGTALAALKNIEQHWPEAARALAAISCGAVMMGAMTYIGNGPNFMVKAIAERDGVEMPSFFGYMRWSAVVLLPILVIVTLVFFRG